MIKVNDEVKQLARTLADWAADKSVTVFLFGSRVRGAIIGRIATLMSSSNLGL
jgi:predicted nucleotidyltransferase